MAALFAVYICSPAQAGAIADALGHEADLATPTITNVDTGDAAAFGLPQQNLVVVGAAVLGLLFELDLPEGAEAQAGLPPVESDRKPLACLLRWSVVSGKSGAPPEARA